MRRNPESKSSLAASIRRAIKATCLTSSVLLLTACGGGGGGGSSSDPIPVDPDPDPISVPTVPQPVSGGGVKGPMANALVTAYRIDTTKAGFVGTELAKASTNSVAEIVGLSIDLNFGLPFILVIEADDDTIDLNSGKAPVIKQLKTVVTPEMLRAGKPLYATPLTSMAVDMAVAMSDSNQAPYQGDGNGTVTLDEFTSALAVAAGQVVSSLGYGMETGTDLYRAVPLIDENTASEEAKKAAVRYRTAVESVAATVVELQGKAGESAATEEVMKNLAEDLADGEIDGRLKDRELELLKDINDLGDIVTKDPAQRHIPDTDILIGDLERHLAKEAKMRGVDVDVEDLETGVIALDPELAALLADADRDGVADKQDRFPFNPEETADRDNDGVGDNGDRFPDDASESRDSDNDGYGDNADRFPHDVSEHQDSDGDGVGDNGDRFPDDASESRDSDGDGYGDNADLFPEDATEYEDSDGDGIGNNSDAEPNIPLIGPDKDRDGVADSKDAFPEDAREQYDTDGDGVGDNQDRFPNDRNEHSDLDGDGIGDNSDGTPLGSFDGNISVGSSVIFYVEQDGAVEWNIYSAPENSAYADINHVGKEFLITPDVVGRYDFQVKLTTPGGQPYYLNEFMYAHNSEPAVVVNGNGGVKVNELTVLDASRSSDADGHLLSFSWELISAPDGSVPSIIGDRGPKLSFIADKQGEYVLELTVSDGWSSKKTTIDIGVSPYQLELLPFSPVDAEYSEYLDSIIAASTDGGFHIYNPFDRSHKLIDIPFEAKSVSAFREESYAIVAGDNSVGFLNLDSLELEVSIVGLDGISEAILGEGGYVYLFPAEGYEDITVVDRLGSIEKHDYFWGHVARGKMHPDGKSVYLVDLDSIPVDMAKYRADAGSVRFLGSDPYHGAYPICDDLWPSNDGLRMFSACGNVFRSSDYEGQDMKYNGALEGFEKASYIRQIDREILVVSAPGLGEAQQLNSSFVYKYDNDDLSYKGKDRLPVFKTPDGNYPSIGKYIFYSKRYSKHFVVTEAFNPTEEAPVFGIASLDVNTVDNQLVANISGPSSAIVGTVVTLEGRPDTSVASGELKYFWRILNKPQSSNISVSDNENFSSSLHLTADVPGVYQVALQVSNNGVAGKETVFELHVSDVSGEIFTRIPTAAIDAEYSDSLERLVWIGATPSKLYQFSVNDRRITELSLPGVPYSLSVSPDGKKAVVGYAGQLSYIDLADNSILKTVTLQELTSFPYTVTPYDIVLTDGGYAYVMPNAGSWVKIQAVNLNSGAITFNEGRDEYNKGKMALSDDQRYIYIATTVITSNYIKKYAIDSGYVALVGSSQGKTSKPTCGGVWSSEDNASIFTRCGNVLYSSESENDMEFFGELERYGSHSYIKSLDRRESEVAVLYEAWPSRLGVGDEEQGVSFYSTSSFELLRRESLPEFPTQDGSYEAFGRFLFYNSDGSQLIVIVQSDEASGLLKDYGIFVIDQ